MNAEELSSRIDDLDKRLKALEQWLDHLNEGLAEMMTEGDKIKAKELLKQDIYSKNRL